MCNKFLILPVITVLAIVLTQFTKDHNLPIVAIANYGSHASLHDAITGFKQQMVQEGFVEDKTIVYKIADVGFDPTLIPQVITHLKITQPKVMMVMTTPVAQVARQKIHHLPLVYNVITDPIAAGLIQSATQSNGNITGCADRQDLDSLLNFILSLLPQAKRIGLLYATSESNDTALLKSMQISAKKLMMEVIAIPIEQSRDIPIRMQEFKNKVDFIYIGASGPIQPALPIIATIAQKMHLPVFNMQEQAVKDGLALASFGVDYIAIGKSAGKLVAALLRGKTIADLPPIYPQKAEHYGVINKKLAQQYNITIPVHLKTVE